MAVARRQQKRLGKGLDALLGDYSPEVSTAQREQERLPVSALRPNPFQPRAEVDRKSLEELVASIRENGLLQPVVVRPVDDGGWEIVAGERRFRAVKELGWADVPVVVHEVDDRMMLVLALIENLQREDLNPLDEARAYRRLVDEFGLTQAQVAQRVGERLPISALRPNPFQPRADVDRKSLEELIASIRENGLLQPVVVRPVEDGGWEIVAGERRFRAVQELGWTDVPVVVHQVDDRMMLVLALIENLQREDLNPLDEARAYRRLVDEFGLTQAQVAQRVGRDRSTVANTLRLLGLPESVRLLLSSGAITAGHARALLGLDDQARVIELARAAAETGLSVREIERRVRQRRSRIGTPTTGAKAADGRSNAYAGRAEQALARALGTAVRIKLDGASRGKIEIPFRDAEDFERIVEAIVGVGGIV